MVGKEYATDLTELIRFVFKHIILFVLLPFELLYIIFCTIVTGEIDLLFRFLVPLIK